MATLIHEIWQDFDEDGHALPGLCLAGPDGEAFRASLASNTRLLETFHAKCHFDAMTHYYAVVGYGAYDNKEGWSHEPYADAEADKQSSFGAA